MLGVSAAAQPVTESPDRPEKIFRAQRASTPPVIDGVISEEIWFRAPIIDDLHQVNPVEFAQPSERTEVRVLYDRDALYIAARMYDSEPGRINARVLRQNQPIGSDDRFFVHIDPYNTRRSGYLFGVNANGVRFDGVYEGTTQRQFNWDGIWQAAASVDEEGWTVEIEIPFKTLSFDPATDTWRMNFARNIERRNESIAWVSQDRRTDLSTMGDMRGISQIEQGRGLDVIPTANVSDRRAFEGVTAESDFQPSLDVFYKVTPQLNASLTVNTDFSATEVDDRQVNLTRFGLFFPEKRDFFLQDADIFEFGNIDQNGRPFFSRRIGLSSTGNPVDLDYGGKISGRIGRFNLGALAIRQDGVDDVGSDNAVVARASANLLRESNIGFIATEGDPQSNIDNSLAGIDFLYRNSRLPGGKLFETNAWMQQSSTAGIDGDDRAYGFRVASPNNRGFRGGARFTHIEAGFNPALGFVNRSNIEHWNYGVQYTARPDRGYLRSILGGFNGERVENITTGQVETEEFRLRVAELEGRNGDELSLRYQFSTELLTSGFEISDGIVIPAGEYDFEFTRMELSTADQRRVWGRLNLRSGDFYNGTRDEIGISVSWRPSGRFFTSLSYEYNDIEVIDVNADRRRFETRLASFRTELAFSSTLSWVTLIQYDNLSENIGINSRVHWIPQAGREAFLVLNHTLQDLDRDNRFHTAFSEATVKFSYTFRY